MSSASWEKPVRDSLRQALDWMDDPALALELRAFARDVAAAALKPLPDEQSVTDAVTVLRRAVDRCDLEVLRLAEDLPTLLRDGRFAEGPALLPLGAYALARGAIDPLISITQAALMTPTVVVPPEWIAAILEAEDREDPRPIVIDVLSEWLPQVNNDFTPIAEVLRRRPEIMCGLRGPLDIPL